MKLLALVIAAVLIAACAPERAKPLPAPAHWVGSTIWVPTGDAPAMAAAVCEGEQNFAGHTGYRWAYPYAAHPLQGGETISCELGVREDFTSGR